MKVCRKCGSTEFYASGICKPCKNAGAAKRYAENPDKDKARANAYYANNTEKVKAEHKKRYASDPKKVMASQAKWVAANKDRIKTNKARWLSENKELGRIYSHNKRARKRANGGTLSKGLAEKLYKLQRGKCACCCKPLGDDYHMDHRMPIVLGGANEDWNMQLLTQRCNNQKYTKHPIDFMQSRGFLL